MKEKPPATSMYYDFDRKVYAFGCIGVIATFVGPLGVVISAASRDTADQQFDHALAGLAGILFGATILQTWMVRGIRKQLTENDPEEVAAYRFPAWAMWWTLGITNFLRVKLERSDAGQSFYDFFSPTIFPELLYGMFAGLTIGFFRAAALWNRAGEKIPL